MLSVRQQGFWGHCSSSFSHPNKGYLFNEEKRIHISELGVNEALNSETLKKMRKKMVSGEVPPECAKCQELESLNKPSLRQLTNDEVGPSSREAVNVISPDGSLTSPNVELLELRLTNKCNISCRSCSPESSNQTVPIHAEIWGEGSYWDMGEEITFTKKGPTFNYSEERFDWVEDKENWNALEEVIPTVRKIHFTGGEPFLIKNHSLFLEKIIEANRAQDIIIEYNTNLTILPDSLIKLWPHFKRVQIGISIDGPPRLNEYIRNGLNHATFEKNLFKLDSINLKNLVAWFPLTLMNYNIFKIPETMSYLASLPLVNVNKHKGHDLLRVHALRNPSFLSVENLPVTLKEKVHFEYQSFLEKLPDNRILEGYQEQVRDNLNYILKLISKECTQEESWEKFIHYTSKFDEISGFKAHELCPELNL